MTDDQKKALRNDPAVKVALAKLKAKKAAAKVTEETKAAAGTHSVIAGMFK